MGKRLLILGIALSLAVVAVPGIRAEVETPYLIIRDVTGSMPTETFENLVKKSRLFSGRSSKRSSR